QRLLAAVPDPQTGSAAVAVSAGEGNRRLFESLGATVVEGGPTMNPSAAELVAAVEGTSAPEAVLLPNNGNVILAADQAAKLAERPVSVVPTRSLQAGLAALVAFDPSRAAAENATEMEEALTAVATGAVTRASRAVQLNGRRVEPGELLGLLEGEPFAGGDDLAEVARAVVDGLLAEPRGVLTFLTGVDGASLDGLVAELAAANPELEIEVHE